MSGITTEKAVSIHITREEFGLLSTLMAPLHFDESRGSCIWVSSEPDGSRTWTVRDNEGAVAVVNTIGARADLMGVEDGDETWAFPVTEATLIAIGRCFLLTDIARHSNLLDPETDDEGREAADPEGEHGVVLTLSDSCITLHAADMRMTTPQNHRVVAPPMRPEIDHRLSFDVDPTKLWCILWQARIYPASGECEGMNTPMVARVDPSTDSLEITVDFSAVGNGVSTFTVPIEWHMRHQQTGPTEFVMPHGTLRNVLRDPHNARGLQRLTFQLGSPASTHVLVWGPNWWYYVPAIPEVTMWGHDLDEVLGDTYWSWKNAAMVKVWTDDLDNAVDLTPLPDDPSHAPYRYRVSYEICASVVPTVDLYNEVNLINGRTAGYRLVIDGSRVVALTDYTNDNYRELERHIAAFARQVKELPPLLTALSVS